MAAAALDAEEATVALRPLLREGDAVLVKGSHFMGLERLVGAVTQATASAGLTSDYTLVWLAVGASTAWWISQLTFPSPPRKRIEAR